MKKKSTMVRDAVILCVITLCCGLLVAFFHELTAGPIAANEARQKEAAYRSLFAGADSFEENPAALGGQNAAVLGAQILTASGQDFGNMTVDGIVEADQGTNPLGYIVSVTSGDGYGGDISVSVGIGTDGKVTGVEILSISETAGLGMKAQEESFRSQYVGRETDHFTVTKSGSPAEDEIEALSGATITSRAMTNSVNAALTIGLELLGKGGLSE